MNEPKPYNATLEAAYKCSSNHRTQVLASERCGCFHCLATFSPLEINDWTDPRDGIGQTAVCPKCGIDAVIGSQTGFLPTPEFLKKMHDYWFEAS